MSKWKQVLKKLAVNAEKRFDELSDQLTYRLGMLNKLQAVVYHSYAGTREVLVKGRVLEDRGIRPPSDHDSRWQNLLNTYKRLGSNEIPNALLEVRVGPYACQVRSDEEGYFEVTFPLAEPLPEGTEALVSLLDFPAGAQADAAPAKGRIFTCPHHADFGVISDVDDTIMQTGATNLLKMAWATFTQNARTRIAFKGVSAFYQGLQAGPSGQGRNPFFYVSSSPWNLFDLLHDFIAINEIPQGPLLLRDYGIDESKLLVSTHGQHKRQEIERVLLAYPHLPFVLIGDSGQEDAFIYHRIAKDYPGRIRAIYIRDAQVPAQAAAVLDALHRANAEGIQMVLVPDSLLAARHALANGLLHEQCIPAIEREIIEEDQNDEALDRLLAADEG
jgi:phosphatidate phosphatase APP1